TSFLAIGLLTALAFTLVAFEWTAFDRSQEGLGEYTELQMEEEEILASTTPPPPPPPPPAPTQVIEIVEDEVEVQDKEVIEMEVTETT
ncbi:MAG TPA: energy transducer TonB, partial [Flavobacteriales bacterium]|nr:energy transducer TonB [Flavobacteriales bacterium]